LLQQNSNAVSSVLGSPGEDPTRLDADAVNIIRTPGVAVRAAQAIRYHGDPLALLNDISVQSNPNTDFLQIVAQASTGAMAARIANGFARGYVELLTNKSVLQAKQAAVLTQQQLLHLSGPDQATARATLNQQLSQLRILESYPQSGAQQVNPASAPTIPITPQPTRDAIFGAAIALLLGVLLCFALERVDRRIKRIDELELLLGTPVLAAVPHTSGTASSRGGAAAIDADITEPFRTLRAVVRLAATGESVKTVLVTSGLAAEGKSTVARNLALAYCETDLSVLIIDCDLRGPVLDRMLTGSVREVGLTDVLAGAAMLDETIVRIGVHVSAPGTVQPFQGESVQPFQGETVQAAAGERLTIDMLPAGGARANPATLLETPQFATLLETMRRRYDVVVIDSAPILPVSDSLPLVSLVDGGRVSSRGALLVVFVSWSSRLSRDICSE
jgi:Mrp family chromosome partitioning ATPase